MTETGLYCPAGGFYIDPWNPVDRAIVTHAHADHARPGSRVYLAAAPGEALLRARLGPEVGIQSVEYGEKIDLNGVRVSLHPAGHIRGSAQVRIEHAGEVWVVSGDYKLAPDPTCLPLEPLRCHAFLTEATFGLPIFRWPADGEVLAGVREWWRSNRDAGRTSVLFAHPMGTCQRLLTLLDGDLPGPVYTHEAVETVNEIYRGRGIPVPATQPGALGIDRAGLVLAPQSAHGSEWSKRFAPASTAFASGWMQIRGTRRRRALDRGFVFSDHADWTGILRVIEETHAESVWVTSGYRGATVRWLEEHGRRALGVETRFEETEA
jgi:putative mRNA 3-end processing factor